METTTVKTELLCPFCGRHDLLERERALEPDTAVICAYCAEITMTSEEGLRKPTDEEVANLMRDPEFVEVLGLARSVTEAVSALRSSEEDEDGPPIETLALVLSSEGVQLANGEQAPPELAELAAFALKKFRVENMSRMIRKHVTAEVANHVLSAYGDEDASMPNITTAALISLIRLCVGSDEEMLMSLMDVHDFHGYVLGVTVLAEHAPEGIEMLKMLAGFISPDDGSILTTVVSK
jgi:hypothetical protein